jgi:hypothetical protein
MIRDVAKSIARQQKLDRAASIDTRLGGEGRLVSELDEILVDGCAGHGIPTVSNRIASPIGIARNRWTWGYRRTSGSIAMP